jgi:glycosyltransferase involved in cell wall biosynthesis
LGNMQFLSTWVAAFLGRLRGKRILMWTHGALRHESGLRGILRKTFYRLAHGLLLYGHRAKEILKAQGFDENRLYVVYNSLDTGEQNRLFNELAPEAIVQARQKTGVAPDIPLLISIGRMTPGKDLHLLPLALAELKAAGRRVDLVFVGDGPARREIEDLVLRHGIGEQVYFMGEIYAEADLCPLIAAADICVCPGAVGLTSMHALIYGTPVITHDQPDWQKPEYEAIKAGITGAFFHRGNAQDLARTIETWLATNHDRTVLRNVCRESLLRHYTPENQRIIIEQAVDALPATGIEEIYQHPSVGPDRINALP